MTRYCIKCGYPIKAGKCDCSSGVPTPETTPLEVETIKVHSAMTGKVRYIPVIRQPAAEDTQYPDQYPTAFCRRCGLEPVEHRDVEGQHRYACAEYLTPEQEATQLERFAADLTREREFTDYQTNQRMNDQRMTQ